MLKRFFLITTLIASGFALQGCASKTAKAVDQKLTQESTPTPRELSTEAEDLIQSMPGLTDQQRLQLTQLRADTRAKIERSRQESLKLRGLLLKDLAATKYNRAEVNVLKKKFKKSEEARVTALLDAVEKANVILGRELSDNEKHLNEMYFDFMRDQRLQQ